MTASVAAVGLAAMAPGGMNAYADTVTNGQQQCRTRVIQLGRHPQGRHGPTPVRAVPVVLYSSIYAQNLLGYSPVVAGLAALPLVLPLTAAAQVGGRWFDRAGVRSPVVMGLAVATIGFLARAAAPPASTTGWAFRA